ncbi:hypothetical protein K2X33_11900 [bacterium]|nr:hypothetical protein [bacterium]
MNTMQKKLYLGMLVLCGVGMAGTAPSMGGSSGGGGGLAEKNFVMAHQNIANYASICLASAACRLTTDQTTLLDKIVRQMPGEGRAEVQLVFDSEKANPGMFYLDGAVRVAKTGGKVGDTIYVNRDMLYTKDASGVTNAMTLPTAVAILVHELGHHHGATDHTALDALGGKVEAYLGQHSQVLDGWLWDVPIRVTAIYPVGNSPKATPLKGFTQVIFSDTDSLFDITPQIEALDVCYEQRTDTFVPAQASFVYNMAWEQHSYYLNHLGDPGPGFKYMRVNADKVATCGANGDTIGGYWIDLLLRLAPDGAVLGIEKVFVEKQVF